MYPSWRLCQTFLQIFNSNYSMRVQMHTRVISVHLENIVCFGNCIQTKGKIMYSFL